MTREAAIRYVAEQTDDDAPIQGVLGLLWAWCPCESCGQGGACAHRDKRKDLEEIMAVREELPVPNRGDFE